jgi:hypothetical protein
MISGYKLPAFPSELGFGSAVLKYKRSYFKLEYLGNFVRFDTIHQSWYDARCQSSAIKPMPAGTSTAIHNWNLILPCRLHFSESAFALRYCTRWHYGQS